MQSAGGAPSIATGSRRSAEHGPGRAPDKNQVTGRRRLGALRRRGSVATARRGPRYQGPVGALRSFVVVPVMMTTSAVIVGSATGSDVASKTFSRNASVEGMRVSAPL